MLNRHQLKDYRELRGLTTRNVEAYCNVSHSLITLIESGQRSITKQNHDEICKGINLAYQAKKNGTLLSKKESVPDTKETTKTETTKKTAASRKKKTSAAANRKGE